MPKQTAPRKRVSTERVRKRTVKTGPSPSEMVGLYLPPGSQQRTAATIAAAAGGALLAAAVLGVGPAALAGAAGYLVYRETKR